MLDTFHAGETIRFIAKDLTHTSDGPVTTGATVTVTVLDAAGAVIDTGTATTGGSGDDWYVDLAAPDTPGVYDVKITAVKSGATWKSKDTFRVDAF
jgi:hypothetical protein